MAEKPKNGEKSKIVESEPSHPAKRGKLTEKTREKVKGLVQLGKFEKSEIGQEILASFGSVAEMLESEDSLNPVLGMLAVVSDDTNREAILVFLKAASKKFPEVMRECVRDPDFDGRLRDRLIEEMGWKASELTVKTLKSAESQSSAEKQKPKKGPKKGAENHESLANELEKTEVFREVSELLECDGMMEDLRKRYQAIDWDKFMVMDDYSVKGIESYVKKNKLTLNRPLKIESVDGVVADPKMFELAVRRLEWDHENVDPRHFGVFILMATEKNPRSVFNYFSSFRYAELRDPYFKKAVVDLLVQKGYPATEKMFEPPAENPESNGE